MEKLERDWFELVATGKDNARSRTWLMQSLDMTDRQVRRMIGRLKDDGLVIVNDRDGNGYYVTDDLDEIQREYRAVTSMAMALLKRRTNIRNILIEAGRDV